MKRRIPRDCELCGESMWGTENAEMYDPQNPEEESVLCHAQCGLNEGMEIA